jgi:hypothetical protein
MTVRMVGTGVDCLPNAGMYGWTGWSMRTCAVSSCVLHNHKQ